MIQNFLLIPKSFSILAFVALRTPKKARSRNIGATSVNRNKLLPAKKVIKATITFIYSKRQTNKLKI